MATAAILLPARTPSDYHRIVSPTLCLPSDTQISIPVGILACQRDPLLLKLDTTVISCTVSQPPAAPTGKKAKKAVLAPALPSDPILEVILHDTVIFPEGGGQPTDTGIITTVDGTVWAVVQAKRHGGHAVHYVRVHKDVDSALLAFSPGQKVKVALDQAGSNRRYDHMSMHTSQHLLSALLESSLNLPTLSWSLTAFPAPCYVEIPRGMTADEIASIQNEANRLVFEGRRVHVEVEELDRQQVAEAPKLESGRSVGKALPADYTGGIKRVVVIDGVDKNPCCGTHLPSLHNLQLFLVPHTDALSRSNTTSARLYFFSGPRLLEHLTSTHSLLANTASLLSCGALVVPERVTQVVTERKQAEKRVEELELELAKRIAHELFAESIARTETGIFRKHIHRTDVSANLSFLSSVSLAFSDLISKSADPATPFLVVLSSSSAQGNSSVVWACGSDAKQVKELGEGLKQNLGVKGGGQGTKWSGKLTGVAWTSKQDDLVAKAIDSVVSG